jgi:hypothetical protein
VPVRSSFREMAYLSDGDREASIAVRVSLR